jgi:RNA polymerase sigma-70 factor (ECF subfamily)
LIRCARQGDRESRERLFERLRGYLRLAARAQLESWLKVKVDASDLVQQTMLEAHCDFDRFQGDSERQLLAWLRKILLHNVADFVRHYRGTAKRQVRREVPLGNPAESGPLIGAPEPAAPGATPSQEFLRRDDELRLVDALEKLPPDYQEVILLRNLQRLPFNEVAEQMGRSRPAVQMLWKRAIDKLRDVMGDEP